MTDVALTDTELDLLLSCIGVALTMLQDDPNARQLLEALQTKLMRVRNPVDMQRV